MRLRHVLSTKQFLDIPVLNHIFNLAADMEQMDWQGNLPQSCRGKILAAVFYEPSTRTRFSFETAMLKLGGNVITTESAGHFSSATKGETLGDTIQIMGGYADIIVLRHPMKDASKAAAESSLVPLINAGDGNGEHPTQALLDMFTIRKELGRLDNISVALVGDLLYGRTVHSLVHLLAVFPGVKIYLVSPKQLSLPEEFLSHLREKHVHFEELSELNPVLDKVDVLYVTRVQKERFATLEEYDAVKDSYVIDKAVLSRLSADAIIMHPLPRVNEISPEVDADERAAYFRQAKNGLYIRMALLHMIAVSHDELREV